MRSLATRHPFLLAIATADTSATSQRPALDAWISGLIIFGLLAIYGYWLLRRVERRAAMVLSTDAVT